MAEFASSRRAFLLQLGAAPLAAALAEDDPLLRATWTARWITVPGAPPTGYGVYHFRRTFELDATPAAFVAHASADNRYQLFVNGRRVLSGPARGDLFHWRYETLDLAPFLQAGGNTLAAIVWNCGDLAPEAQITFETGFLLQCPVGTDRNWKCLRNEACSAIEVTAGQVRGYWAAGPCDRVDAAKYPWGWEQPDFDDSAWPSAAIVSPAAGREAQDVHSRWMLVPRNIPAEEQRPEPPLRLRAATGVEASALPVEIPASTHAMLLLDQTYLTTGFPELTISGGRGARIRIGYAESMFPKGNRNDVEGKQFVGYFDEFLPDGAAARTFRPLWWRTWRYLQLEIETAADALHIDSLRGTFTAYPFVRRARFESPDPELTRILDTGWRTARLCAHETYMDCPYYEQLQYVGDTRVQCLVSLFNSGDARLMRNAIELIDQSRQAEGATMSRYPTRLEQFIPGFSLWWIGMVHDYWRYVDEPAFVREMLPGVRAVLSFFESYQRENGSLRSLPWWRYFDWVPGWPSGNAPQGPGGNSALFDLLLLIGYRWAGELEAALGRPALADFYGARERQLRQTVQQLYWTGALYADTPEHRQFSQHANTLAVLADAITGEAARDLMRRAVADPALAVPGLFFQFYVHQAFAKVGDGDTYLDRLGPWRDMLAKGLTTFAEVVDRPGAATRSDCHAWSASPNIEILRTVLGVDSAAPGFRRVSVRPHLGPLTYIRGAVPHPRGLVEVAIESGTARIVLPADTTGTFQWKGVRRDLAPGESVFPLPK
jgi:hypothetical protein